MEAGPAREAVGDMTGVVGSEHQAFVEFGIRMECGGYSMPLMPVARVPGMDAAEGGSKEQEREAESAQ